MSTDTFQSLREHFIYKVAKHPMAAGAVRLAALYADGTKPTKGFNYCRYTKEQAALYLKVSVRTIHNWIKLLEDTGFIRVLRHGRAHMYEVLWGGVDTGKKVPPIVVSSSKKRSCSKNTGSRREPEKEAVQPKPAGEASPSALVLPEGLSALMTYLGKRHGLPPRQMTRAYWRFKDTAKDVVRVQDAPRRFDAWCAAFAARWRTARDQWRVKHGFA